MSQTSLLKPAPRSKNWLLAKSRQWHAWGGVIAALFLLLAGASGIVLNYKKPILTALGLEMEPPRGAKESGASLPRSTEASSFTTGSGLDAAAFRIDRVLELARQEWGEVPLERIELKDERGGLLYKVKRRGGPELWVNAATGSHFVKGEYEKPMKPKPGATPDVRFDWGKLILDLHTGRIGGEVGKAVMSFVAVGLLFLSVSGLYLWAKPLLIRFRNGQAQRSHRQKSAPSLSANLTPARETPGRAFRAPDLVAAAKTSNNSGKRFQELELL